MKPSLICSALAAAFLCVPAAAAADQKADQQALAARVEQLATELEKVKAELAAQRAQAAASTPPAPAPAAEAAPATVLSGYGEINYNHTTRDASQTQADVRRAVIGLRHRFDDKTRLVSEFEWEHAVVSADDHGETEVEQLYVERDFANALRGRVGLFLMPAGLLNLAHEPTAYYGVERNFVETAIIPTTWREAGIGLSGELPEGLSWDAGLTTGFDLSKWDPASADGLASPLGAIHQEGQLAKARNLAAHGALNWRGVPGLLVGGFLFSGKAGQELDGFAGRDARVVLWDLHTRYTPGAWDLSALYAHGRINNTDALNDSFAGNPTLVPSTFAGWYLQAAYRLVESGDYTLSPFARYERFNTAKSYSALPPGQAVATPPDEQVLTVGANLRVGQGVVLKGDYQRFVQDKSRDRVNLGVGFSY